MTINDAKYYKSNTVIASDAQGDLTRILETVTHTINGKLEQKLLTNRTIPILPPTMNPGIFQGIALIVLEPQTLLMPAMKEIAVVKASSGALG